MNRLLQLLIALLAIINCSVSDKSNSSETSFFEESIDDFASREEEENSKQETPPQQETNPDFFLIDDMILSPLQYDVIYTEPSKRNGYSPVVRPWPNAVIPYMIDDDYSAAEKSIMRTAMAIIERETCVRFHRLYDGHNETDYVYIQHGHGCASTVGFWGGKQILFLHKKGCMDVGRILHELLHLLGMFHMHTAIDRDEYIKIEWNNVIVTAMQNFVAFESDVSMYGTSYDFDSVTHYPPKAFSKDGKPTITSTKITGNLLMGQRDHLSVGDIQRVNRMYNCA